jgi:hypothetical protein
MATTYTSPFTGTVVEPTDVSYYSLSFTTSTQLYWPAVVNPTQVPAARIMDCSTSTASLNIILPQGNQGSVGTDILIRNTGSVAFAVVNFSGTGAVIINPGISIYFYLTNNSTEAGVWKNVTFGAGTSSADAAALAGNGLTTTLAGKLATTGNVITTNSTPTIADSSRAATYVWTGGAGTFTLPNTLSLSTGWYISFRNGGTGTLTIQTTNTALINGLGSIAINPGDSGFIFYQAAAGNFYTVGWATPVNVSFSAATYDVDSIIPNTLSLVSYAPIIQTYVSLSGTRTQTLAVTLPAITQLYVLVNDTNATAYNITFQVSGSTAPPLSLSNGQIVTILTDAGNIYILTQSTLSIFYAGDGTAATPTYSFLNDTHTGMYLQGTSKLGFSVNSTLMLNIDNTNTSLPVISTPATFNAKLIPGGTF